MQYMGKEDLSKLFRAAYAANKIHHLALLTQFYTGTRVSQLLDIRGEDIFEKDGRWVILIRAAKRGNVVVHPLHIDSEEAFDMSPLIELSKTKGQSRIWGGLSRQYLNLSMKRYAEAAGIHSSFAHSHCLRHSSAIIVFDATQRIGAVTQFLGHKSPSSAFVYLQENDSLLAQGAMDNLQLV